MIVVEYGGVGVLLIVYVVGSVIFGIVLGVMLVVVVDNFVVKVFGLV